MVNSHSYLQMLAKDEAVAFVASLQKVKEHLSHELQRMSEQVQQKTIQLQGIETLLSEAEGMGLAPPTSTQALTASSKVNAAVVIEAVPSNASKATASPLDQTTLAVANGNNLAANAAASMGATVASPPPKRAKQRQQSNSSQPKRDAKLSAVGKTSPAKTEKPARSTPSSSDASKTALSGFQKFLQTDFQDKSMTEAVGEILESATQPMNTDAIMAELYHGLSNEAYDRAKSSLSNILSVGKTKGKWKSPARGMYVGNAVVAKTK